MGFIAFIILGLIAGAIAKAIRPGEQGGGWLAAGVGVGPEEFWSRESWRLAIGGAIVVLLIWGLITGRRSGTRS